MAGERAAEPVARERGWTPTVLVLLAALAVAAAPLWPPAAGLFAAAVRLVVPIEQTMLLVALALAACTLVGWWAGGRAAGLVIWLALAGWVLAQPMPAEPAGYAPLARGWALVLAGAFGLVSVAAPRQRFLPRALGAIGLAAAVTLSAALATGRDPRALGRVLTSEYARRAEHSLGRWREARADGVWLDRGGARGELAARASATAEAVAALPPRAALLAPALAGLESLAALALAWGLHHRLSRTRIGPPLGTLRAFRFNDQLIWGLVVGAVMVLVPSLAALDALGVNLLVFFGALYALRGVGVFWWWTADKGIVLVAVGGVLLLSVLGFVALAATLTAVALAVGLGDTWQDWRRRSPRPTG